MARWEGRANATTRRREHDARVFSPSDHVLISRFSSFLNLSSYCCPSSSYLLEEYTMSQQTPSSPTLKAEVPENQGLIDALVELADAAGKTNRFKGSALRRAAKKLADLRTKIESGKPLASGPHKVGGVGQGTAYYIDEYLEKGHISETDNYKSKAKANPVTPERKTAGGNTITINRAPVLTLWVIVVAERQGYNSREAATYGKWISGIMAHAKGKKEGRFEDSEEPKKKKQRFEHVQFFSHIKVPIVTRNGNRLAVNQDGDPIDYSSVESYLERAFGSRLVDAKEALEVLANSMSGEELHKQAYSLYETFRPPYKGWGQKSLWSLDSVRQLATKQS